MFAEERTAFEGTLESEWLTTPVHYDNVSFTPGEYPWIRPTIIGGESSQITLGPGQQLHRAIGFCIIQVFVREGTGTAEAKSIADGLCDLFRSRKIGRITCGSPHVERVGKDGDGWFQLNVVIPFFNESTC